MAKYMITWQLPPGTRNEAIKRFMGTDAARPPDGLKELGRWHAAKGDAGYLVVETENPKFITNWLLKWSDLMVYEVEPVITDEELGELFVKHGFGK
jgi:hypothetical protein